MKRRRTGHLCKRHPGTDPVHKARAAWKWNGNLYFRLVIGLAMLVNLIFAGLSVSSIPLLMKKIGMDPAQNLRIILTTVTDVI